MKTCTVKSARREFMRETLMQGIGMPTPPPSAKNVSTNQSTYAVWDLPRKNFGKKIESIFAKNATMNFLPTVITARIAIAKLTWLHLTQKCFSSLSTSSMSRIDREEVVKLRDVSLLGHKTNRLVTLHGQMSHKEYKAHRLLSMEEVNQFDIQLLESHNHNLNEQMLLAWLLSLSEAPNKTRGDHQMSGNKIEITGSQ